MQEALIRVLEIRFGEVVGNLKERIKSNRDAEKLINAMKVVVSEKFKKEIDFHLN